MAQPVTALLNPEPDHNAAFQAFVDEMLLRQRAFNEIRTPCPDWCDKTCEESGDLGDSVMHVAESFVATTSDRLHEPDGTVLLKLWFYEGIGERTEAGVELDVSASRAAIDDTANFSAVQARLLAAELCRLADLLEPEQDLPAEQVRVGDCLPVGGEWLCVYSVTIDEPSNNVQIFTTVDRGEYPEANGGQDEKPHMFGLGDTVRVRRGGAR